MLVDSTQEVSFHTSLFPTVLTVFLLLKVTAPFPNRLPLLLKGPVQSLPPTKLSLTVHQLSVSCPETPPALSVPLTLL